MRQVERQVMLKIIDTKWREHLYEMDYLQEGINLRAMGQKDPLTEWQREGYEMFGMMMKGIAQDLVRYVMHVQVTVPAARRRTRRRHGLQGARRWAATSPRCRTCSTRRLTTPTSEAAAAWPRRPGGSPPTAAQAGAPAAVADPPATMTPVVKSDWDKTPRNAPCPCGSGKKFKLCHGKA